MTKKTSTVAILVLAAFTGACSGSASSSSSNQDGGRTDEDATVRLPDGRIVVPDGGSEPEPEPGDPGCGFDSAAFCDTFDTASPGGRAGDLDETKWLLARVSQDTNPTQGVLNSYPPALATNCDGSTELVTPPNDYRFCNGQGQGTHLIQTFDDGGSFVFHSFSPRRPFDFADRMGTVRFDLGGRVEGGHGWWIEIWIVDEPVPGPYQEAPGVMSFPRNGVGLKLGAGDGDCGEGRNGLSNIFVMRDFELVTDRSASDFDRECFDVSDDALNRYELRMSQTAIELWTSAPGEHEELTRVARIDNLELPFTRGFVHFQKTHYNANKDGNTPYKTFHWDNIGFDGPVYPMVRAYDVPDALEVRSGGSVNLGYAPETGSGPGERGEPIAFTLSDVDTSDIRAASIDLNANNFVSGLAIAYRVNGGEWLRYASSEFPYETDSWHAIHLPIPTSSVRDGDNTIEIAQEGNHPFFNIANVSLSVIP